MSNHHLLYTNEQEAGCDEAGRGCLAGPVFAAAVILSSDTVIPHLDDSKKLSSKQREKCRSFIEREAISWAIGIVSADEIDQINILTKSMTLLNGAIYGVIENTKSEARSWAAVGLMAAGSLVLALLTPGGLPPLPTAPAFWQATAYLVLGCTVFAFFAQNWALKHIAPTRVALLTSSEPVFGALFAVLWLGEGLSAVGWLGGALIVLAALWTTARRT